MHGSSRSFAKEPWSDLDDFDGDDSDVGSLDADSGNDTPSFMDHADASLLSLGSGASNPEAPGGGDGMRRLPPGSASLLAEIPEDILPAVLAQTTKRRGKGGRQPAPDPRLDGKVDPKRVS